MERQDPCAGEAIAKMPAEGSAKKPYEAGCRFVCASTLELENFDAAALDLWSARSPMHRTG